MSITRSVNQDSKRIIHNFAKEVGRASAVDRTDYGTASGSARGSVQHHGSPLATALARRHLWRAGDAQNISTTLLATHACRALVHDRSQCPTPLRAGLLGPRVVSPHPQGLQGSHLNLRVRNTATRDPSRVHAESAGAIPDRMHSLYRPPHDTEKEFEEVSKIEDAQTECNNARQNCSKLHLTTLGALA